MIEDFFRRIPLERDRENLGFVAEAAQRVAQSFGVDLKARQADSQILAMQVPSTPTLVVNGKYRVNNENLESADQIINLVKFLVAKESAPATPAAK